MPGKKRDNSILISLIGNVLLVIGKGVTGLLANSNALVADAIHSMTDVYAFFISYRACRDCELCGRIDNKKTSETITQRIVEIETQTTYYAGIVFLTVGIAICFHNLMILVLDKFEKPDSITVPVAFVVLAVYAGLYKYAGKTDDTQTVEDCIFTTRNANWQNKMNLVSGTVVAIGLTASMFGFVFMDELAAAVVGAILLAMGVKLIMETKVNLSEPIKRYVTPVIISSILVSAVLATISLSVQL